MKPLRPHLLAAALLLLAGSLPPVASAQDEEEPEFPGVTVDADSYTDHILGFRIAVGKKPWAMRPRREEWFGAHPPAVAFSAGDYHVVAVHVRDAGDRTLAENAMRLAEYLVLTPPPRRALLSGELGGQRAISFETRCNVEKAPPLTRVTLTERDGLVYAVAVYTFGDASALDSLCNSALPTFKLLDGAEFRRVVPTPDVEGTGWRLRDGIAEHALAGVRLSLAPGWKFGAAPGTPSGVSSAAVDLCCPSLEVGIRIQGIPLSGRSWEVADVTTDYLRDIVYTEPKEKFTPIDIAMDGGKVHTVWKQVRGDRIPKGGIRRFVQWGRLRGDARAVTVEVIHPRWFDPRIATAIRDAMARIGIMAPESRTALASQLEKGMDTQVFAGPEEYLRQGTYRNTRHKIQWKKPSPLWLLQRGAEFDATPNSLAEMSSLESGVTARLWSFRVASSDTKWTVHERLVDKIRGLFGEGLPSKPQPATLGSRDSVRSYVLIPIGDLKITCHVVTTNPAGNLSYGVTVMCFDREGAADAAEKVLAGLRFQTTEIPVAHKSARGWEDPAYGFRVEAPAGAVKTSTLPPEFAGGGGAMVLVESGNDRVIVAAREWPDGEPEVESSAVLRVLAHLDPEGIMAGRFGTVRDVPGTLCGEVTRDRIHEGSPFIRIACLRRCGTLYVVGIASAGPGPAPETGPASWFKFSD